MKRPVVAVLVGIPFILVGAGVWLYLLLQQSLPQLEGSQAVSGLSAPVTVERDALGVPTIRAANRLDVARAMGFLHGQERFFQMDLMRRRAAGEIAELFGPAALEADRAVRLHRLRYRARDALASFPADHKRLLATYTEGVNQGIGALGAPPLEYVLGFDAPRPWLPEDSVLVMYAMYLKLQDGHWSQESMRGVMYDVLPEPLYRFLGTPGTEWDAPLQGEPFTTPPTPTKEIVDLRTAPRNAPWLVAQWTDQQSGIVGSNSWAVAGTHTSHGGALLANDMHLGHSVPNTWYRATMVYMAPNGEERRITGVTLPGTPVVAVGSTGKVAWGFTNSYGDWADLVIVETVDEDADAYLSPNGARPFKIEQESIRVKGAENHILDIVSTIWGPLIDTDHLGRPRALRWVAHDRRAVNLGLLDLEAVQDIEEALDVANRTGIPAQNFVVADASGRIAWTIMGPIPRRFELDGSLPTSWANGKHGWNGWLEPAEYPRIVDPPAGRIWTANARVVSDGDLAKVGDGGYDLGARARQIREHLFAIREPGEAEMFALQLDDRALFLERWRNLLLQVLKPEVIAADPRRAEFRRYIEAWGGRASVDSVAYRMVRAFRLVFAEQVFAFLTAACKAADSRFDYSRLHQAEGPLWRLLSERPLHLLSPRFASWREQLIAAVDATLDRLMGDGSALAEHTWGVRNTVQIQHPLSRVLPLAGRWLDMPAVSLPGDTNMPRVQAPTFGATQRLVVSPGRETDAIFHMPGGQSGHPLSPYYRNGHAAWARAEPTTFLPGLAEHRLRLLPGL